MHTSRQTSVAVPSIAAFLVAFRLEEIFIYLYTYIFDYLCIINIVCIVAVGQAGRAFPDGIFTFAELHCKESVQSRNRHVVQRSCALKIFEMLVGAHWRHWLVPKS